MRSLGPQSEVRDRAGDCADDDDNIYNNIDEIIWNNDEIVYNDQARWALKEHEKNSWISALLPLIRLQCLIDWKPRGVPQRAF